MVKKYIVLKKYVCEITKSGCGEDNQPYNSSPPNCDECDIYLNRDIIEPEEPSTNERERFNSRQPVTTSKSEGCLSEKTTIHHPRRYPI